MKRGPGSNYCLIAKKMKYSIPRTLLLKETYTWTKKLRDLISIIVNYNFSLLRHEKSCICEVWYGRSNTLLSVSQLP